MEAYGGFIFVCSGNEGRKRLKGVSTRTMRVRWLWGNSELANRATLSGGGIQV